jgi:GTPase SAR1 family protein
MGGFASKENLP